jgi:hypothetical protein
MTYYGSQSLAGVLLGVFCLPSGGTFRKRAAMALTDTEIRRAKPRAKSYNLRDGGNLYVSVSPTGGKLWRWKYRYEGKEKLMSFGKYPDVSLALARERHGEARKLLANRVDPMAQRKSEKTAEPVATSGG